MLAAMEDEIEQMVLRAQGPQRRILHCRFFRAVKGGEEGRIEPPVGCRVPGEKVAVDLHIEAAPRVPIGRLLRIPRCIPQRLKAQGEEKVAEGDKFLRADVQVLVRGGAQVRLGIEAPAQDTLDHQRLKGGIPERPAQLQKSEALSGLLCGAAEHRHSGLSQGRANAARGSGPCGQSIIDHGEHLLFRRQAQQRAPVLLRPGTGGGGQAPEGGTQGVQKLPFISLQGAHLLSVRIPELGRSP